MDPEYQRILALLGILPMTREEEWAHRQAENARLYPNLGDKFEGWGVSPDGDLVPPPPPIEFSPPAQWQAQRDVTNIPPRGSVPQPFQLLPPEPAVADATRIPPEGPSFTMDRYGPDSFERRFAPVEEEEEGGGGGAGLLGLGAAGVSAIASALSGLGAAGGGLMTAASGIVPLSSSTVDMFKHYLQPFHPKAVIDALGTPAQQLVLTPTSLYPRLAARLPDEMPDISQDKLVSLIRSGYENILQLPELTIGQTTPKEYITMGMNLLDNMQEITPSQLARLAEVFNLDTWQEMNSQMLNILPMDLMGSMESVLGHDGRHRIMAALSGLWDYIPTIIRGESRIQDTDALTELLAEIGFEGLGPVGLRTPDQYSYTLAGEGAGKFTGNVPRVIEDVFFLSSPEEYVEGMYELAGRMGVDKQYDFWERDYNSRTKLLDMLRPDIDWEAFEGRTGIIPATPDEVAQAKEMYDRYRRLATSPTPLPSWFFDQLNSMIPSIRQAMGPPGSTIPPGTYMPKLSEEIRRLMKGFDASGSGR